MQFLQVRQSSGPHGKKSGYGIRIHESKTAWSGSTLTFALATAMLFASVACHDHSGEHATHGHSEEVAQQTSGEHSHAMNHSGLDLNEGKRWAADRSTREGIHRMQRIVEQSGGSPGSGEVQALRKMHAELQGELKQVIEKCEMEGRPHEMLHVYLNELTPHIQSLQHEDPEVAQQAARKLPEVLARFDNYFE